MTHHDKLDSQPAREATLEQASAATGSARNHTFLIANYCDEKPDRRAETEIKAFEILHSVLSTAEKYVQAFKQQQREKAERELAQAKNKPSETVGKSK